MLPGAWTVTLHPDTPKSIRDALDFFGHVVILDSPVDPRRMGDASLKAAARYSGILRHRPTAYELGGPGMVAWLGDEQGKGNIFEAGVSLTNGTFAQWVAAVLPASLHAGTISAIPTLTLTRAFNFNSDGLSPRGMMDFVMLYFGGEYRVNPNGTLDAGLATDLFHMVPTAVVQRLPGGRDLGIIGLSATQLDYENDADDWTSRILFLGSGGIGAQVNAASNPYKDFFGNAVSLKRFISDGTVPTGAVTQTATQLAAKWSVLHSQVVLATNEYDIGRDVQVGDNLYVYDPERGIVDTTNQVRYRGGVLFPQKVRVLSTTWPIERGLGVYYRDLNGIYTDLTSFVAYESPGTRHEVGAVMRRLV